MSCHSLQYIPGKFSRRCVNKGNDRYRAVTIAVLRFANLQQREQSRDIRQLWIVRRRPVALQVYTSAVYKHELTQDHKYYNNSIWITIIWADLTAASPLPSPHSHTLPPVSWVVPNNNTEVTLTIILNATLFWYLFNIIHASWSIIWS